MEHTIPQNAVPASPMIDLRVRRSREGLRAALLDLLEARAFEDITIREVAARAGVGYTTFFRHYPGKEALLDDVAADEIRSLTEHAMPIYDSGDPLSACLALCSYVERHRALWSALLTGGAAPIVREEMLKQAREATVARSPAQSLPADLGTALAIAVIVELLSWWLRQSDPWPAARLADVMNRTAIAPLLGGA
jgi:AcrR family transcriptional regulator